MADAGDKRNLKISQGLHRRLKMFSVYTGRSMEDIAEHVLEVGLTQILAQADDPIKAVVAVKSVLDNDSPPQPNATNPKRPPRSKGRRRS